jgi:hypothetical protein
MGRTACTELQCLYKGALYLYHKKHRVDIKNRLIAQQMNFVVDKLKKKVNPVNNYHYVKAYRGHGSKTRSFVDETRYGLATNSLSYPHFSPGKVYVIH